MAPSRFKKDAREKREVTPFNEEQVAPPEIPAEWRDIEAPVNFTWVVQDELAGMGWPKSRDQVSFLIRQGIDHIITLAADKIPPHYAFPELKWTMIPVEDFTGPAITDIKKFIQIMAEARRDGEAVGVHCAEGRGRTGVICACYLIYYYDMEPWDAIRIMRRQRPGSVERKVQEETVVMFYDLLHDDFGCLDNLEEKEKEYRRYKQQQQLKNDNLICAYTALLHGPVNRVKNRDQRQERMRRARSMPKMNDDVDEAIKDEVRLRQHFEDFFQQESTKRRASRERSRPPLDKNQKDEENLLEQNRFDRGTTPGRVLISNLKPAPRKSDVIDLNNEPKCDLKQHFKEFMSTTNNMKRARSFSQPRDKNLVRSDSDKSRTKIGQEKCEDDRTETEKISIIRRQSRATNTNSSQSSGSERASTASSSSCSGSTDEVFSAALVEKTALEEVDNKENSRKNSVSSIEQKPPQPPRYKPSLDNSAASGTSSYYARVRTRANRKDQLAESGDDSPASSAPGSTTTVRKFDANARKYRSKTIEVSGYSVEKTTPTPVVEEEHLDKEVESILKEDKKASLNANVAASKRPPSSESSLKVEPESGKSRLSPFNRFRASLVAGSNRESPRKQSTEAEPPSSTSPTASTQRPRTKSETSPSKNNGGGEKRRFFYRKSRTGPLPGDTSEADSMTSTASNSTSNLGGHMTLSQEEVSKCSSMSETLRHSVRAKSEFNPRTVDEAAAGATASTSTASYVAPKDNLFLAAAKRWASYDKPSYQSPFTRDHWKRSHRKFNYPRFLNYTRETFV